MNLENLTRSLISLLGTIVPVTAGCALPPTPSTSLVATPRPTATPTTSVSSDLVDPGPTEIPLPSPAPTPSPRPRYLATNGHAYRDVLSENQGFTCRDVKGTPNLLWTCSLPGTATISFYGSRGSQVCAIRVETPPSDPGDWMRAYASIVSIEVYQWVADRINADSLGDESEMVDGVLVRTAHDKEADSLLIRREGGCP